MGSVIAATIPATFGQTKCNVLIDTGAMKSCMSQTYYQQFMLPSMRLIHTYQVRSATSSNLCPLGIIECGFKIGEKDYKNDFVVCKNLTRPCVLGIDFLRKHGIFAGWTPKGKFLITQQEFLVESLDVVMNGPMIHNKQGIAIPGRGLVIIDVSVYIDIESMDDQMFEVKPNLLLTNEHPNLVVIPMLHKVKEIQQKCTHLALLNLAEDESIFLKKGKIFGHLEPSSIEIGEILKEDWSNPVESDEEEENIKIPLEKKFLLQLKQIPIER